MRAWDGTTTWRGKTEMTTTEQNDDGRLEDLRARAADVLEAGIGAVCDRAQSGDIAALDWLIAQGLISLDCLRVGPREVQVTLVEPKKDGEAETGTAGDE